MEMDNKFQVLINAMNLAHHTINITKNKNIFLQEYQSALTDDIIRCAKDIYVKACRANRIKVNKPKDWIKRCELQEDAILNCGDLLTMIQLAKVVFHLKSKKVKHWAKLTIEVRDGLKAWNASDSRRYSKV